MTVDLMTSTDNMFDAGADALVCPVNCVGVLGAGLARIFAGQFPGMIRPYEYACDQLRLARIERSKPPADAIDIGRVIVIQLEGVDVICLPTKDHWRHNSKMEYVEKGVTALADEVEKRRWKKVAVPALGCGLGGLDWKPVCNLLNDTFFLSPTRVLLYPPR